MFRALLFSEYAMPKPCQAGCTKPLMVELYWGERESESDIAWNGYISFSVVCLHWVAMSSDEDQRECLRSLQNNSA